MPKDLAVIIVAGGMGARMGANLPKQFLLLGEKPVLVWSLEVLGTYPAVTEVVLVLPEEWLGKGRELCAPLQLPVPVTFIPGGAERQDSVWNGMQGLQTPAPFVAVHDAARPGVDHPLCDRLMAMARVRGSAIPGLPVVDTLVKRCGDQAGERLDRREIVGIQTPQVFRREILRRAYERARAENLLGTDESGLVARIGEPVFLVPGSPRNRKITSPEDLQMVAALL